MNDVWLKNDFEKLLKKAMGLDTASIGSAAVERAIQVRMQACDMNDARVYFKCVAASSVELQALIEVVVVPETWFFRDREAFTALTRLMLEEWLPKNPTSILRILSLPCSTGEEPCSMTMALLDAGLPADRFSIDAVDISSPVLNIGRAGVYGKNSFRGSDLDFRKKYFEALNIHDDKDIGTENYRIANAVRNQISFQQGNLFAPDFLPGNARYDYIFCRNLLIYFDRPTQDFAVGVLQRLMTPQAALFVAPSETGLLLDHRFSAIKLPLAFAFRKPAEGRSDSLGDITAIAKPAALPLRKTGLAENQHKQKIPVKEVSRESQSNVAFASRTNLTSNIMSNISSNIASGITSNTNSHLTSGFKSNLTTNAAANCATKPGSTSIQDNPAVITTSANNNAINSANASIEAAMQWANQGRFAEAAQCCESHLQTHGASAPVFYLKGVICAAQGKLSEASQHYRKALYLDPHHQETLIHLACLLDKQGDIKGAQMLRNRAQRIDQKAAH